MNGERLTVSGKSRARSRSIDRGYRSRVRMSPRLPLTAYRSPLTAVQIQDNSFLIEEAYNQERGVVQHISNLRPRRRRRLGLQLHSGVAARGHSPSAQLHACRFEHDADGTGIGRRRRELSPPAGWQSGSLSRLRSAALLFSAYWRSRGRVGVSAASACRPIFH